MKYRPDIDGLRAIAVVSVVFYHLGVWRIPGGFVGVDVFFVISGFLITRILAAEMDAGRFSIAKFYERRARRIFPALFFMVALTIVAAWFLYFPYQLDQLGQSVLATVFFASNILYYTKYNYFEAFSVENPLLHTWSLAVEEQFYILFPLLLFLITKFFRHYRVPIIAIIAIISLLYSHYLLHADSTAAFYMSTARAWELAIGALLALDALPRSNRVVREILSVAGLCLLLYAFTKFLNITGPLLLIPCSGAALLIYGGQSGDTFVARVLSIKPLVWIGLISYSLYLWHNPLIVFYQFYFAINQDGLHFSDKILLLSLAICLAFLSWRYVEQPFRTKVSAFDRKQIFVLSAGAIGLLAACGLGMVISAGFPSRFAPDVLRMADFLRYNPLPNMREGSCFLDVRFDSMQSFDAARCLKWDQRKPNYLLIGDSHSAHLWIGLHDAFPEINLMQATATGCKPFVDPGGEARCTALMNYIFTDYLPKHHVDALLLSGRWHVYEAKNLTITIGAMRKYAKRIVVFGPSIEYMRPLPELLATELAHHDRHVLVHARLYDAIEATDRAIETAASGSGVQYISTLRTLCDASRCSTTDGHNDPLQMDYGHLTRQGSDFLAYRWRAERLLP